MSIKALHTFSGGYKFPESPDEYKSTDTFSGGYKFPDEYKSTPSVVVISFLISKH